MPDNPNPCAPKSLKELRRPDDTHDVVIQMEVQLAIVMDRLEKLEHHINDSLRQNNNRMFALIVSIVVAIVAHFMTR